jgi:hypothetical protein
MAGLRDEAGIWPVAARAGAEICPSDRATPAIESHPRLLRRHCDIAPVPRQVRFIVSQAEIGPARDPATGPDERNLQKGISLPIASVSAAFAVLKGQGGRTGMVGGLCQGGRLALLTEGRCPSPNGGNYHIHSRSHQSNRGDPPGIGTELARLSGRAPASKAPIGSSVRVIGPAVGGRVIQRWVQPASCAAKSSSRPASPAKSRAV